MKHSVDDKQRESKSLKCHNCQSFVCERNEFDDIDIVLGLKAYQQSVIVMCPHIPQRAHAK